MSESGGIGERETPGGAIPKFLETDIVIVVVGVSGSGKSAFINDLIVDKRKTLLVDPDTTCACTTAVTHVTVAKSRRNLGLKGSERLVMVDTPGFNFGYDKGRKTRTDLDILREIQTYLDQRLPGGGLRGGVLYLHDLSVDPQPPKPVALDCLVETHFRSQLMVVGTKGKEDKTTSKKFDKLATQMRALNLPVKRLQPLLDSEEVSVLIREVIQRIQAADGKVIDIANMKFQDSIGQDPPRKKGLRNFFSKFFR